jgi:chromate transporter
MKRERLKGNLALLDGTGPAAIGAILGSAIPWPGCSPSPGTPSSAAAILLLALRRGVVLALLPAAGLTLAAAGLAMPRQAAFVLVRGGLVAARCRNAG